MTATKGTMILPPPTANVAKQFPPYLRAKDINAKGITKITLRGDARKSNSRFGDGIDVACKIGNKQYTWTIKFDCANYRILFERFGSELANWKGIVKVERKEYLATSMQPLWISSGGDPWSSTVTSTSEHTQPSIATRSGRHAIEATHQFHNGPSML